MKQELVARITKILHC
jgi:hypothetical protein